MQTVFRSEQRGGANHGWLLAKHSFSFADWYEPSRMGFGVLRVINEDRVAPKSGFATHGHRDMEILTYILAVRSGTRTRWATENQAGRPG